VIAKEARLMAEEEELQLLRLIRAFVKIKDKKRRLEIVALVEAAARDYSE
jgi:hypothetical protein